MIHSTLEMTHEEWLKDRKKGIGGSDVATILGLNKWKSAYQLWLEKTGQIELEQSQSEPAYWGNVLEEVVAKEFTERTGKKVRRRNRVFEHDQYSFLRANIDRDVVGENAILECKTASAYLSKEWLGDEVPLSYLCQVQHYMNVLNAEYCYMAVLIGGQKFIWKKVERDQELINLVTERLVDFWQTNVIGNVEPVIDGTEATSQFLKERYATIEDSETSLPSSADDLIEEKRQLKVAKKEIDEQIRKVDNELTNELGKRNATIGITAKNIVTWKLVSSKRMNTKKLVEKYPDVVKDPDIYNVTESRRLVEKEIK